MKRLNTVLSWKALGTKHSYKSCQIMIKSFNLFEMFSIIRNICYFQLGMSLIECQNEKHIKNDGKQL